MKSFLKFLAIFAAILLTSAVLAPVLFQYLPYKFERIFNRLVMIFSLAAVIGFVRIRHETLARYGLVWQRESPALFLKAFVLILAVLFLLTAVRLAAGQAVWAAKPFALGEWGLAAGKALAAGLVVAVIEEFFFRGFIFSTLRDKAPSLPLPLYPAGGVLRQAQDPERSRGRLGWGRLVPAFIVTNLFYSLIHFVDRRNPFIGPEPAFADSLKLAAAPFLSLSDWRMFWPEAAGLFLFGLILTDLRVRTGSLYPAIGLHAGGVFFIKMDGLFVDVIESSRTLIFGTKQMVDGVVPWIFLVGMGILLRKVVKTQTGSDPFFQKGVRPLLILVLISLIFPAAAAAQPLSSKSSKKAAVFPYLFHEHLSKAEASLFFKDKEQKGIWKQDRFVFPALPSPAWEIRAFSRPSPEAEDGPETWIRFDAFKKVLRRLKFPDVPPGSSLKIIYGMEEEVKTENAAYLDLRIWAGQHEVKRIRVPNKKGVDEDDIDLGLISFLGRKVVLTFEVAAQNADSLPFQFYAEIAE